jgi:hypothetical protein
MRAGISLLSADERPSPIHFCKSPGKNKAWHFAEPAVRHVWYTRMQFHLPLRLRRMILHLVQKRAELHAL